MNAALFRSLAASLAAGLLVAMANAQSEQVSPTQRHTGLPERDKAALAAIACGPRQVGAIEIIGLSSTDASSRAPTRAQVKCEPHIRADGAAAGYRVYCHRANEHWVCDKEVLYLQRKVASQGPFDFPAHDLTFEEAQSVIACVEDLVRSSQGTPQVQPVTRLEYLLRLPAPSEDVRVGLKRGKKCLSMTVQVQCRMSDGRPRPATTSACD